MYESLSKSQKISIMIGGMLAMLLSALDQTIVSTALPRIAQDLQAIEHLSWVFTAYMLASTVTVPIYGKLSDVYGRKVFYIVGIVIFLIGSMLCGVAQSMNQLIVFRALQGIGGGAIMVNSIAIIGDIFPPMERGKWQGLIGAMFGLASVAGPLLGGWLTDAGNWRWVFYVNLPLAIIAVIVIYRVFPSKQRHAITEKPSIDYLGSVVLAGALMTLLLACVWGGTTYAWDSFRIVSLFSSSGILFIAFGIIEQRVKEPILPLALFKSRVFSISVTATFLIAMGMFGTILYIPLFAQSVIGVSATNSGLILTPMMIGLVFASAMSGQIVSRTGKYKILTICGMLTAATGMYLLSGMTAATTNPQLVTYMIITGLGLGVGMPIFNVIVQSAFDQSKLGVVSASTQLFRSVGGTVGAAILGTIMNNRLADHIATIQQDPSIDVIEAAVPQFSGSSITPNMIQNFMSPAGQGRVTEMLQLLPDAIRSSVQDAFAQVLVLFADGLTDAITATFFWGSGFVLLAGIVVLFLPEIPLRKTNRSASEEVGVDLQLELGQSDSAHEPDVSTSGKE